MVRDVMARAHDASGLGQWLWIGKGEEGVADLDREEVELRYHRSFLLALLDRPREAEALYYVRAVRSTQIGR